MNDAEIVKRLHISIHGLRLMKDYKPSELDKQVSLMIIERFKNECSECKERGDKISGNISKSETFLDKLRRAMK